MKSNNRPQLGRGLSALFAEINPTEPSAKAGLQNLPTAFLQPSPLQPRRIFDEEALVQLASSIKEKGLLQPIVARRLAGPLERYEIIAGERRWRASQKAGLHEVPVLVRDINDEEVLEVALIENLQRQDLSILEEAEGYQRLIQEFNQTQEEVAKVIGKSRSHIANTLRLLGLPESVKSLIQKGSLTAGHARALLTAKDPLALAQGIIQQGLNVRQTEVMARTVQGHKKKSSGQAKDSNVIALEQELADHLGVRVLINSQPRGAGTITLHYKNLDDLDRILEKLKSK